MTGDHMVPDWRHRAACADADPELFFPVGETGPAVVQVEAAKAVCGGCPVVGECLSWSVETRQVYGVWGGRSEGERQVLMRRGGGLRAGGPRLRSRTSADRDGAVLTSAEALPLGAAPDGSVRDSAVMPGKWRQAGEVEPRVLFGAAAVVVLVLAGAGAVSGGRPWAVVPSLAGALVLALLSVVVGRAPRPVPAHAARVTRWTRLDAVPSPERTPGPSGRTGLRLVEASCESCRRAPASVRVVFTDGAVFVVCPPCARGALSVGPSCSPAGDAGGRPAA